MPGHVHNIARVAVRAELIDAVRHRFARNERPILRSRSVAGIALDSLTVRRRAAAFAVDVQAVAFANEAIGAVGIRDDEELVVLAGSVLPLDDACSACRAAAGNVKVLIRMQEAHRVVAVAVVLDGDRMDIRPDMHARAVFGAVARDVPAIAGILRNGDVIHAVSQRVRDGQTPLLSVGLVSGINLNVVALSRAFVRKIQIQAVALGLNTIVSVSCVLKHPELRAAVVGNVLLDVRSGVLIAAVDVKHHAGGHVADGIAAVPDRLEDKLLRKHVAVCTDLDVCGVLRAVARDGDEAVGVHSGGDGIGAVIDGEILRLRSRVGRRHVDVFKGTGHEIGHLVPRAGYGIHLAVVAVVALIGVDIVAVAAHVGHAVSVGADVRAGLDLRAEDALEVVGRNADAADRMVIAVAAGDLREVHDAEAAPEDVPGEAHALPAKDVDGLAVIVVVAPAVFQPVDVAVGARAAGRGAVGAVGILRQRERYVADLDREAVAGVLSCRRLLLVEHAHAHDALLARLQIDAQKLLFAVHVNATLEHVQTAELNGLGVAAVIEQLRLAAAERQTVNAAVGEVVEHVLGDHELIDPAGNALDLAALERRERVGAERRAVDGVARDQKHIVAHGDGACVRDAGQLGSALEEVDELNRSVVVDAEAVLAIVDQLAAADRGGEIGRNGFPRLLGQGGILNCRGKGRERQQHCDRKQHG